MVTCSVTRTLYRECLTGTLEVRNHNFSNYLMSFQLAHFHSGIQSSILVRKTIYTRHLFLLARMYWFCWNRPPFGT